MQGRSKQTWFHWGALAFALGLAGACVGEAPEGGATTPTCASYCSEVMSACTGANAQYASDAECRAYCAGVGGFAAGNEGDADGNTIGCRTFHAGAAASDPSHCAHAGPTGGDACGSWCDNYCALALDHCTGASELYPSLSACQSACAQFPATGAPGDAAGDTVQCRIFHLGAAAADAVHCAHGASDGGGVCVD